MYFYYVINLLNYIAVLEQTFCQIQLYKSAIISVLQKIRHRTWNLSISEQAQRTMR